MGWEVADDGLKVLFSRDIPTLVREDLRAVVDAFLARHGLSLDEIDELLQLREGGRRSEVRGLAEQKVRDIDEKVSRLKAMREALTGLITACSCKTGSAPQCPIIEALDDPGTGLAGLVNVKRKGPRR